MKILNYVELIELYTKKHKNNQSSGTVRRDKIVFNSTEFGSIRFGSVRFENLLKFDSFTVFKLKN